MTIPAAPVSPVDEETFNLVQEFSNATFGFVLSDDLTDALAGRTGVEAIDENNDGLARANGNGDSTDGVFRFSSGSQQT